MPVQFIPKYIERCEAMYTFQKRFVKSSAFCFVLSCCLAFNLSAAHTPHKTVERITELAIQARPKSYLYSLSDHGFTSLRSEQRRLEREALTRVREALTDYSKGTVRESVKNFLMRALSFPPIEMVESVSGRDKESTFIVSDGDHDLYVRVFCSDKEKDPIPALDDSKAYNTRDSHFIRQLAAADLMHRLHLVHVRSQKHLSAGFAQIEGDFYYFVAGPDLPGKNMQQMHTEIFKSKERARATHVMQQALARLGNALGAIHAKNAVEMAVTPEMLMAFESRMEAKLKAYQRMGGEKVESIKAMLNKQLENLAKGHVYLTYCHGSANLKKFFYDEISDTLAMKELYEAHASIGQEGEPVGLFAGHDFISLHEELFFETHLLAKENASSLTHALLGAFTKAYHAAVGDFNQPALQEIERSLKMLERYTDCLQAPEDALNKISLKYCVEYFKSDGVE